MYIYIHTYNVGKIVRYTYIYVLLLIIIIIIIIIYIFREKRGDRQLRQKHPCRVDTGICGG